MTNGCFHHWQRGANQIVSKLVLWGRVAGTALDNESEEGETRGVASVVSARISATGMCTGSGRWVMSDRSSDSRRFDWDAGGYAAC